MKRAVQQLLALENFHDALKASTIAEEIKAVDVSDNVIEAHRIMHEMHFDVLGISRNGRIVGYLARADLDAHGDMKGVISGSFMRGFTETDLVAESCPLEDCLSKLREKERLFVHTSKKVHGIITRADLHKQPVRMLLFSVVSLLEMALLSLIRREYKGREEAWHALLSGPQLDQAEELLKKRKAIGMEIDLLDCLQLSSKGVIVKKTDTLRDALGFVSRGECKSLFGHLEDMRNALAHGQSLEAIPKLTWEQVFEMFLEAKRVLEKCISLLEGET